MSTPSPIAEMQPTEQKVITFKVGEQEFKLSLNLNTLILIEERFGNIQSALLKLNSISELRWLLWTLLDESMPMTELEFGACLLAGDIGPAVKTFLDAFGNQQGTNPAILAPYVPTAPEIIEKILDAGKLKAGEFFIDPGCGDGRLLVAAVKRGARVLGIEIDKDRAALTQETLRQLGKENKEAKYSVIRGDAREADFSTADVVFLYLLPWSNQVLLDQLKKMKSGARVVTHDFPIRDWVEPYLHDNVVGESRTHSILAYLVP